MISAAPLNNSPPSILISLGLLESRLKISVNTNVHPAFKMLGNFPPSVDTSKFFLFSRGFLGFTGCLRDFLL